MESKGIGRKGQKHKAGEQRKKEEYQKKSR